VQPLLAVFISSAVAGIATAPIGAAHFNAIAQYGLLANLSSVPLMGILVIPAAVLALVLAPLGLEWVGLWIMGLGLRWILGVAEWVAALDGARHYVPGPGGWVLPLLALGFLMLVLWQGRLRWSGLLAMAAAFLLWQGVERPAILIADTGSLVGVLTPQGRALSKPKGAGFIARNWLENDGEGIQQPDAAARWGGKSMRVADREIVHLSGKRAVAQMTQCRRDQIVVASVKLEKPIPGGCTIYDPASLLLTGAIALEIDKKQLKITTARQKAGARLWTQWRGE
jgi:competence protein ComEC